MALTVQTRQQALSGQNGECQDLSEGHLPDLGYQGRMYIEDNEVGQK
jgi:hypothetical protein